MWFLDGTWRWKWYHALSLSSNFVFASQIRHSTIYVRSPLLYSTVRQAASSTLCLWFHTNNASESCLRLLINSASSRSARSSLLSLTSTKSTAGDPRGAGWLAVESILAFDEERDNCIGRAGRGRLAVDEMLEVDVVRDSAGEASRARKALGRTLCDDGVRGACCMFSGGGSSNFWILLREPRLRPHAFASSPDMFCMSDGSVNPSETMAFVIDTKAGPLMPTRSSRAWMATCSGVLLCGMFCECMCKCVHNTYTRSSPTHTHSASSCARVCACTSRWGGPHQV